MGTGKFNASGERGNPAIDQHPIQGQPRSQGLFPGLSQEKGPGNEVDPGEVKILLVTLCYRNWR